MSNLSERLKQYVRNRASNRCEYCLSHQNYVLGHLQIDHIRPVSRGGTDEDANLCLSCELCNQYKWTQTEGIDPQTSETVELFNPRQQQWTEHFRWDDRGTNIVGKTACGRATIEALKLNNSLAITVRHNWVSVGWHPPIR
jgi:hypothetical protein